MKTSVARSAPLSLDTEYLVQSELLGAFRIRADNAIDFADGLLGFPQYQRFALVRAGTDAVFWLQSLDDASLVFLLVDPFVHFVDYAIEIPPVDVQELEASDPADIALLSIVTLPEPGSGARPTANLQGPVVVNLRTRRAKQVVCPDSDYGVRCTFEFQKGA